MKGGCLKICLWAGGGLVGLFVALLIGATLWEQGLKSGCNNGKSDDCESLLSSDYIVNEDFDLGQITNEEFKPKFVQQVEAAKKAAADTAEANKKAAEARRAQNELADLVVKAMTQCEGSLKAAMKDPDSFQVHNRDFASLQIEYSATNSFGGRIRNVMDCKTGKNLR